MPVGPRPGSWVPGFGGVSPGMLNRAAGNHLGRWDPQRPWGARGRLAGDLAAWTLVYRDAVLPFVPGQTRPSVVDLFPPSRLTSETLPRRRCMLGSRRRRSPQHPLGRPLGPAPSWHPAGVSRLSVVPCHPGPWGPRITAGPSLQSTVLYCAVRSIVLPTSMSLEPAAHLVRSTTHDAKPSDPVILFPSSSATNAILCTPRALDR